MLRGELRTLAYSYLELDVAVLLVRLEQTDLGTSKRPAAAPKGYQSATSDPLAFEGMLERAFEELGAREELGLAGVPATGGFTVGDFDTKNGAAGGAALERLLGEYPDALRVRYRSVSDALNGWWRRPLDYPDLSNAAPTGWYGFELRDARGYVVLPGTFTSWGCWALDEGSLGLAEAWELPLELAERFKKASDSGVRVASSPAVELYVEARKSYTPNAAQRVAFALDAFDRAAPNGRHPALLTAAGRIIGLDHVDLGDAVTRLRSRWDAVTAGEGRERELDDVLAWLIAQELDGAAGRLESGHGLRWNGSKGEEELLEALVELAPELTEDELPSPLVAVAELPAEFWDRGRRRRIVRMAHERRVAPTALLGALLVEALGHVSPRIVLPPTIGSHVAPNLFVAIVGRSGGGKSSSVRVAREFLAPRAPDVIPKRAELGSGQGLVEGFLEKDGRHKRQVEDSVLVTADEGAALHALARQRDSTLLTTLREMWLGADTGSGNAGEDARRHLDALTYRLGLVACFTPNPATELLAGVEEGTPQRFLWLSARRSEHPPRTGATPPLYQWTPPPTPPSGTRQELFLPAEVVAELDALHDEEESPAYDSHRGLLLLKVAAALLLLDDERAERFHVTLDDWADAKLILEHSDAVRRALLLRRRELAARKDRARRSSHVADHVAAVQGVELSALERCARRVHGLVWGEEGRLWTRKELRGRCSPTYRGALEEALELAEGRGWIEVRTEPGQGTRKRIFTRGAVAPGG